jgi:hypothetical protein
MYLRASDGRLVRNSLAAIVVEAIMVVAKA